MGCRLLRQSTAITVDMGPALDATDGVTEETALSPTVYLSKAGGVQAARNSATAIAHDARGYYRVELNTTDTNTLGMLRALFHSAATHLPVWEYFMVIPANVYDSLVAGSDNLEVDLILWRGTQPNTLTSGRVEALVGAMANNTLTAAAIAANALEAAKFAADAITAIQSGLATASALSTVDDFLDTEVAAILAAVDTEITTLLNRLGAFTGSGDNTVLGVLKALASKTAATPSDIGGTFDPATDSLEGLRDDSATAADVADAVWDEATSGHQTAGTTGKALTDAGAAGTPPTAAEVADAVWDEALSGHTTAGTAGERLGRVPNAAAGGNGGLPTVDASNRIAGIQGTLNTLDALDTAQDAQHATTQATLGTPAGASLAADIATRASQASVNTIDDLLDTEIQAIIDALALINADTDDIQSRLPAALVGGRMDSNMSAINNSNAAAVRQALAAGTIIPGTVDNTGHTPTTTEFEADDITEATADHYNGRVIIFTSGALLGQATSISDYALVGGRGHFTVPALTEAPANNGTFIIV